MQKALLTLLFLFYLFPLFGAPLKEVELNWDSPSILWDGQTGYIPCKEPFVLKITNCPQGTSSVSVKVYNSLNVYPYNKNSAALEGTYTATEKSGTVFSVLVAKKLSFRRFYYFEIDLVTTATTTTTTINAAPPNTIINPPVVTNPKVNTTVTSITSVTTTPASVAPAAGSPTTTTTVTTTTVENLNKEAKAYTIPLRSEISTLQFLGSVGAVGFPQTGFKNVKDPTIGFTTGLKIKFAPVSTNPNIGRFGIFPDASRWAFIVGTVINDLTYKSTDIDAAIFGLKPMLGLDYEFSSNAGISVGMVLGRQDRESKLNNSKNIVTGIAIALSFSSDVFESFREHIPATQNFPSIEGNKK